MVRIHDVGRGAPDGNFPPYVATRLVAQEGFNTNPGGLADPWLADGATESRGNNVDAYTDGGPDGFGAGDLRAAVTSPGAFDRAFDPGVDPQASNALSFSATIEFLRIKNSWGSSLAPPNASNDLRGYYDLYMKYLDASPTKCTAKDADKCGIKSQTPGLWAFTLPPDAFLTDRIGAEGACLDSCQVGPARASTCGDCESLICQDDPFCCSSGWDATCAETASWACDLNCGG